MGWVFDEKPGFLPNPALIPQFNMDELVIVSYFRLIKKHIHLHSTTGTPSPYSIPKSLKIWLRQENTGIILNAWVNSQFQQLRQRMTMIGWTQTGIVHQKQMRKMSWTSALKISVSVLQKMLLIRNSKICD